LGSGRRTEKHESRKDLLRRGLEQGLAARNHAFRRFRRSLRKWLGWLTIHDLLRDRLQLCWRELRVNLRCRVSDYNALEEALSPFEDPGKQLFVFSGKLRILALAFCDPRKKFL